MYYITAKAPPQWHQMTVDELLFGCDRTTMLITANETNTRTDAVPFISERLARMTDVMGLERILMDFYKSHQTLYEMTRETLYQTFFMEKKERGMPGFFRDMFASQHRYIPCDAGTVCTGVAGLLQPAIRRHETTEHDSCMDACVRGVAGYLTTQGFAVTEDDIRIWLRHNFRRIDAPKAELKRALRELKGILEDEKTFRALYHTSAFAYVRGRSTVKAVKRHQQNASQWFAKFDLSDFFGSSTPEFVKKQLAYVWPFCEICKDPIGSMLLSLVLDLCFLHGGLPQGTPISPMLTNLMMIPIDHKLANRLREFTLEKKGEKRQQRFVYTRYADDFLVSSAFDFDVRVIQRFIQDTLDEFHAPFRLNTEKTRYGSRSGSNWNLGVMLNRENQITVGAEQKRRLKAKLASYILDRKAGNRWPLSEVQQLSGILSYCRMVEPDAVGELVKRIEQKFEADIESCIRQDLKTAA